MAKSNIKIGTLLDPEKSTSVADLSAKKIINGKVTNRVSDYRNSKILLISEKMKRRKIIEPTQKNDPFNLAEKIMSSIGCSLILEGPLTKKDYKLISDQKDVETIENPNKIELNRFKKIKKQKIKIDQVFKSTSDSIFRLDSDLPNNYKQQIDTDIQTTKKPDLTDVVAKAIDMSLNTPGIKTVRGFKEI